MKIAIIGYGRMGHAIEKTALQRGHEIVACIDKDNQQDFDSDAFASADVAIEFTNATQALDNFRKVWSKGIPVVSGTTGWFAYGTLHSLGKEVERNGYTLLHASNFSIGVNLLFALNSYLAKIIAPFDEYKVSVNETHHIHKLDHPSGTAIALADEIIENDHRYETWVEPLSNVVGVDSVPIRCEREGENPGYHRVKWESATDCISISHQAYSRDGFALGAILAAEWLVKQPKGHIYSLKEMFKF